jgi:AI-2 transport protein TqsA
MPRGLIVVLAVTGPRQRSGDAGVALILGPVPLALILAMSVHPLTGILRRRGAPMWLAVTVTLVTLTGHPAQGCPAPRAGNQPTVSP